MNASRVLGFAAAVLCAAAARLPAQNSAADLLQRAIRLYQDVEIEDATAALRQLISPTSGLDVTPAQRAQAYKYLGAVFVLLPGPEARDSALAHFGAAISRDPTVDLEPDIFTPAQRAVFALALDRTFALALLPLRADTLDSRGATVVFRCVTSHAALLRAELRSGGTTVLVLYDGPSNGPREIPWDGMLPGPTRAPEGRYELAVIGRSTVVSQRDSAAAWFDLQLAHPALEDTLPDLGPQDLLPEAGSNNREIPANVAENQRRRSERATSNAAVAERKAEALRHSKLVIVPVAGGGTAIRQ